MSTKRNIFNVPKKVNRHVLKALNNLSNGNMKRPVSMAQILNQVKYQMRNLVPVRNVEGEVQKALNNLSDLGLIERSRSGPNYFAIGRSYAPPRSPEPSRPIDPNREFFKPTGSRKRSLSDLDPNVAKHSPLSDDSLSGEDDFERTRKRLRTNNKRLNSSGREVALPKAKQHNFQSQGYDFEKHFYDEPFGGGVGYIFDTVVDGSYRMAPFECWREHGQQLSAYNSNMEFVLSSLTPPPPPQHSLEIMEIAPEYRNIKEGGGGGCDFESKVKTNEELLEDRKAKEVAAIQTKFPLTSSPHSVEILEIVQEYQHVGGDSWESKVKTYEENMDDGNRKEGVLVQKKSLIKPPPSPPASFEIFEIPQEHQRNATTSSGLESSNKT